MENLEYKKEELIHINNVYDLWDWADKLNVSAEKLKQAIITVGKSASAVKNFLKR